MAGHAGHAVAGRRTLEAALRLGMQAVRTKLLISMSFKGLAFVLARHA